MKCFCDINLHKISEHLSWYGAYGIAFDKKWCLEKGIQAVHYINPKSDLRESFTSAFAEARNTNDDRSENLESYLLNTLMFYKPYQGKTYNQSKKKKMCKCMSDECEWRFVPNVSEMGMDQIIYEELSLEEGVIELMNQALTESDTNAVKYTFSDIKYIIVPDADAFEKLVNAIDIIDDVSDFERQRLVSRILVWKDSEGDF